jgi:ribonuclease HII
MSELTEFDQKFFRDHDTVAGLDEAGRGALAGPVFVGCVASDGIISTDKDLENVNDSKQLSEANRKTLFQYLTSKDRIEIGIGQTDNEKIDDVGINQATSLAAARALASIKSNPDLLLLDQGLSLPGGIEVKSLEKGDERSFHVAAASVLAKVARDRYMWLKSEGFPSYGWESNVGYGTKGHRKALEKKGPSPLHRNSYSLG